MAFEFLNDSGAPDEVSIFPESFLRTTRPVSPVCSEPLFSSLQDQRQDSCAYLLHLFAPL